MASAPDTHPDSDPSGPSDAPEHLTPGDGEDRGNVETPRQDPSDEVESDGAGGTARE